ASAVESLGDPPRTRETSQARAFSRPGRPDQHLIGQPGEPPHRVDLHRWLLFVPPSSGIPWSDVHSGTVHASPWGAVPGGSARLPVAAPGTAAALPWGH